MKIRYLLLTTLEISLLTAMEPSPEHLFSIADHQELESTDQSFIETVQPLLQEGCSYFYNTACLTSAAAMQFFKHNPVRALKLTLRNAGILGIALDGTFNLEKRLPFEIKNSLSLTLMKTVFAGASLLAPLFYSYDMYSELPKAVEEVAKKVCVQDIQWYLAHGIDPNLNCGDQQKRLLHYAAIVGNTELTQLLLEKGG